MKTLKKLIFAMMAGSAIFTSCSKGAQPGTPVPTPGDGPQVQLTLGGDVSTRALALPAVEGEAWEKEIKTLAVYCYGTNGNLIAQRAFNAEELASLSTTFTMPASAVGTQCTFYAMANYSPGGTYTQTAAGLESSEAPSSALYNGDFSQVSTKCVRPEGFVMTGKATITLQSGTPNAVSITVQRTVAKFFVRAKLSPDFAQRFQGGTVVITSALVQRVPTASMLFYKDGNAPGNQAGAGTVNQTPFSDAGGYYLLFYCHEQGEVALNRRMTITLTGYFDRDGNLSTTFDRDPVQYLITVEGSGNCKIDRNRLYIIDVTIKGINGADAQSAVTEADWMPPFTQTGDI